MKNMNEMRDILSQTIDRLIENKITPAAANAITNATGKILTTIKMEMEYAKLKGKQPNMEFIQLTNAPTPEASNNEKD